MAIFPNVYIAMVMISSMGIISMSISYCPYALLGQYHEIKEVSTQMDSTLIFTERKKQRVSLLFIFLCVVLPWYLSTSEDLQLPQL